MKKKRPAGKKNEPAQKHRFSFSNVTSVVSIAISLVSLALAVSTHVSNQDSRPLAYYIRPTVTDTAANSITTDLEIIVTNGAVGDVRVLDYRDGRITEIANNVGGTIRPGSAKDGRTFQFQLDYTSTGAFIATEYLLVHGKDGSRNLSMLLYHIDTDQGTAQLRCYSQEDLLFAELDPAQSQYSNAFSNYRDLLERLKAEGTL